MEKRLFLAFVLSFFILFTWNKMFPQQKNGEIVTKEIIEEKADLTIPPPLPIIERKEERLSFLGNEKIEIEITNLGASIKSVRLAEYNSNLPITEINSLKQYKDVTFIETYKTANKIIFQYKANDIAISKSYELDGYLVKTDTRIENSREMSIEEKVEIQAFKLDVSRLDKEGINPRDKMLQEYSIANDLQIYRKKNAFKISKKDYRVEIDNINWIGFRNRYFCAILMPQYNIEKYEIIPIENQELSITLSAKTEKLGQIDTQEYQNIIYFGPQDINVLKSYDLGFERIINYKIGGFFDIMAFGLTDFVAKIILRYLNFLNKIIDNLGIAIIILAISISVVTYPFTHKSMMSMKKMQAIQPKLSKIREQYKNNPQKLNKEMMELYKENKVNPFGGCLPMLFQMPIFIGLYQVLWRSASLKGASFLWIKDLSEPDRLFILNNTLPIIGNEINILPILMMIVMFFQQKISSKNMVVADPQQAQQQKMMMMFMPLMIGFIFYKFASGLALYFTTFYILSTLTHLRMSKIKKAV